MLRRKDEPDEALGWLRLHGRTNARLLLLARDLSADFTPPDTYNAFATVRGRLGGCDYELRVALDTSDTERTGAVRHCLELELHHDSTYATRTLSGDGLVPPAIDPARVRSAVEATCFSYVSRG